MDELLERKHQKNGKTGMVQQADLESGLTYVACFGVEFILSEALTIGSGRVWPVWGHPLQTEKGGEDYAKQGLR